MMFLNEDNLKNKGDNNYEDHLQSPDRLKMKTT